MNNIEINSVESVILFVLYICIQDGKISDEELNELAQEFPLIEKLYFVYKIPERLMRHL